MGGVCWGDRRVGGRGGEGVWWEIVYGDGGGGGVVCLRYGGGSRGHVTSCENWLQKVEVLLEGD